LAQNLPIYISLHAIQTRCRIPKTRLGVQVNAIESGLRADRISSDDPTDFGIWNVSKTIRPANVKVATYRSSENSAAAQRGLDIVASILLLIFFAPLMIIIAIILYFSDPGPLFFEQHRLGRRGQPFRCWKFRSMVVDAEERLAALLRDDPQARAEWTVAQKLRADPRITRIGRFLRRSSLDELPQLFNVLRGEMSLVGPRPIVHAEIERYGRYFAEYCLVRPGITGLWQISGRNDTSYRRRVALDVTYARAKCLRLDLAILVLTVPRVLLARGSY
jgi:lipopolysaccharide/colanic/teichoic acid biosynthesis glycosyltransferase